MMDEETGAEPRVVSASIADPFLMILRDDNSVFIAKIGSNDELDEVEKLLQFIFINSCGCKPTKNAANNHDEYVLAIISPLRTSLASIRTFGVSMFPYALY